MSAKLMLAMIAITACCRACSLFYPSVQVGPNFRVRVEDQRRPVQGLRVEIGGYQGGGNRAVADTDNNGIALFRDLAPGSYHLGASHDAGIPDGYELEVKLDGPTDVTVPLKWPNTAPVLVRSMKGMIRGPDYLPGHPQPRLSLDLLESMSLRKLKSVQTNESGEFNIESVAPGLYFLSLKPSGLTSWAGQQITGLIPVAVDHGAPADHLDLDLGRTSCGLWYADRTKCPQSDLQIRQLSGQVVDAGGAAIPNATIILFGPAEKPVERLQSDSGGEFTSPHSLAGTYQLVVTAPGFTPLRRVLHVETTSNPMGLSALTVQLGVGGSCSSTGTQ